MKKRITLIFTIVLSLILTQGTFLAQNLDKGVFKKGSNKFMQKARKELKEYYNKQKPKRDWKRFKVDFTGKKFPTNADDYKTFWHTEPLSQGMTGTCWSWSTTSFFESELYRVHGKKIRISPIYNAYWEYVEKVKRYVCERGNSEFGEGSEANAVPRIWKKYGCVPYSVYDGLKNGIPYHDHSKMFKEMNSFLKSIKENNYWNTDFVVETIKSIMNKYIGAPPAKFEYEGKEYTPKTFFKNVVNLNMDDYVDVVSYLQKPFWQQVEYIVPDNWWHNADYYNVPLDDFIAAIKGAVEKGFSLCIGGDVSEPGYDSETEVSIIPTFDIPRKYINDDARQFRFSNRTTTDDHGIHIVGFNKVDGDYWFMIKDSGSGARNGKHVGYRFYREDYVKLKIMDFMVHKDAIPELLKKIKAHQK